MRKIVEFACAGEQLIGTVDLADGANGLLIVSGGNEIRAGAHRGMARLARLVAERGHPVFRFDRRGIGDSSGANSGFRGARPDIGAAIATFRHHVPQLKQLVGFGICDAATALALFGDGIDRLVLANPWLHDDGDGLPNAEAIKARYAQKLREPGTWARALGGGIKLGGLAKGVAKIATGGSLRDADMEQSLFASLRKRRNSLIAIAAGDGTALTFLAAAGRVGFDAGIRLIETDSHSFAHRDDEAALLAMIEEALAG